jgi:hypothetical protein
MGMPVIPAETAGRIPRARALRGGNFSTSVAGRVV